MDLKVAVVILNWNGIHYLETFLPVVLKYTDKPGQKIFVVDNNSTDGSVDFVKNSFPEVGIICFEENHGFARGYARALPQIQTEYYVLLNSDVEVTENWLDPLVRLMDDECDTAAAMPKILSYSNKDHFEYAGAAGGFIDKYGYPFCQGRILTEIEKDTGQYDTTREIFWASGACMFLRSSAYYKAGGLDGDFFAHMEEIDLCWRLKRLGFRIIYFPGSSVFHVGGGTLPNDNPRKLYYNYRNSLFMLIKNLSFANYFSVFFPRLFLDLISALLYLIQGKLTFFMAVFRAHIRFYISLPGLINKRRIFNKFISRNKVSLIYPGSIVFQFFVRKRKVFTDLGF